MLPGHTMWNTEEVLSSSDYKKEREGREGMCIIERVFLLGGGGLSSERFEPNSQFLL